MCPTLSPLSTPSPAPIATPARPLKADPVEHQVEPQEEDIAILYHDAAVIVVRKPAGLLSVPGRGPDRADCAISRVQRQLPDALIVHRLDRDTSGLLLMARGAEVHRQLSKAFAAREVHKRYEAVVAGVVLAEQGEVNLPLICDWPNRPKQMVDPVNGRPSLTRWRVLSRTTDPSTTRVSLEPVTGRSHQLRVHMLSIGHPMVGDSLYAPPQWQQGFARLQLHACELGFTHPVSGEPFFFKDPAPF